MLEATNADYADGEKWTDAKLLCDQIMKLMEHANKTMQDGDESVRCIWALLFEEFYREVLSNLFKSGCFMK